MFKTHRYAYINLAIIAMISLIYFLSTSNDVHAVMAKAASNPAYRASSNEAVALVAWFDGDPAELEQTVAQAVAHNLRINVFVPADWLFENKASIPNAIEDGYIAGVYGRDYGLDASADSLTGSLQADREEFLNAGIRADFYMPNNGEYTRRLSNCASELSMQVVLWSHDSRAFAAKDAQEFSDIVVKTVRNGDFILVRLDDRFREAMPLIQSGLHNAGLRSDQLSVLLDR